MAMYVGSNSMSGSGTITKPAGTVAGDFMMIFGPYGGSVSGPTGGWINYNMYWPGYGYTSISYRKVLTETDIAGSITISSVSYGPIITVVYRGPTSASLLAQNSGQDGTGLALTHSTGRASTSMGWMSWVTDRDGSGTAAPPAGWTSRTGPNASGVFTGSVADQLNFSSLPTSSGTPTWTGFGTTYSQVGFLFEFLP